MERNMNPGRIIFRKDAVVKCIVEKQIEGNDEPWMHRKDAVAKCMVKKRSKRRLYKMQRNKARPAGGEQRKMLIHSKQVP